MPLSLSKLTSNRAHVAIDFGDGDVLNVEYYPAKITGKMMVDTAYSDDLERLKSMPTDSALSVITSPADTILTIVASWDLTETAEDGTETPVPLDRAHVDALGVIVQWSIVRGLFASAGDTSGKSSAPVDSGSTSEPPSGAIS